MNKLIQLQLFSFLITGGLLFGLFPLNAETPEESGESPDADQEIVYEPAPPAPKQPEAKVNQEEEVLSDPTVVLRPEFIPRGAFGIHVGWSSLPMIAAGQPALNLVARFEWMYRKNLTLYLHGGINARMGYGGIPSYFSQIANDFDPSALTPLISNPDESDKLANATDLRENAGGFGYGGGIGGRIRLDEQIRGLYLGIGLDIFYFPELAFQTYVVSVDEPATNSNYTVHMENAVPVKPFVEGGYTVGAGPFMLDFNLLVGVDLIFGDGEAIALGDPIYYYEETYPQDTEFTIQDTNLAIQAVVQLSIGIGFRFGSRG